MPIRSITHKTQAEHQDNVDIYLAGEDVSERRERVVQGLVIDGLVQVLDEDVAYSALPQ